jgi:NYN domain
MKTSVYIDGFNLYYGSLKGTPYKWLDPVALCRVMIPKNDVTSIKYFTARVSPRADDPDQPTRQNIYLRALRTVPHLSIFYGHYLSHVVRMHLAHPQPGQNPFVEVIKTEEKGSDVNLATQLLVDACAGTFDCAVIISRDSDLKSPIQMVMQRYDKIVGVLNPQKVLCAALKGTARFYKHIRESALQASQFPPVLTDGMGSFHKPASW